MKGKQEKCGFKVILGFILNSVPAHDLRSYLKTNKITLEKELYTLHKPLNKRYQIYPDQKPITRYLVTAKIILSRT